MAQKTIDFENDILRPIGSLKGDLADLKDNKITKFYTNNNGDTVLNDSDNGKIQNMILYGKSLQDGTPTPDNPVEIQNVVNPVVKVCGKNLLNYDAWKETYIINGTAVFENNGVTITATQDDSYTEYNPEVNKPFPIDAQIKVNEGEVVTLSWEADNKNGSIYIFGFGNRSELAWIDNNNAKKLSYTVPKGITFITFRFGVADKGDTISYKNIQIEKGSEATTYEPYTETTVTLPYTLNAIPVSSGGNVTIDGQQYIADYVDVEHGKLVRRTHVIKFTGAESWEYTNSDEEQSRRFGLYISVQGVPYLGLSNCIRNVNRNIVNSDNAFAFYGTWVDVRMTKFTSLAEFKNFLSEINSSGKPMIVMYALVTPEEIDLTPEAIEAFKALSTYYPKTYIDAESEQLEAYTMFNYPVSMEKGWEYVKQQIGDTRKYVYDMDLQSAEAYVNSEYAVALTEFEV